MATNYRGIHLTAQLSKVVERMIKRLFEPYLERTIGFGPNQFAYRAKRGARDAIALLMMEWAEGYSTFHRWPIFTYSLRWPH